MRNYGPGQKWLPGTIVATTGPSVLSCPVEDGHVWRRHQARTMRQKWEKQIFGQDRFSYHSFAHDSHPRCCCK